MDYSCRKFTWIFCLVFCFGLTYAENSFQSNSHLFNKDFSASETSNDKPEFSPLENLKSVKIENGYSGILIPERTIDKAEAYLETIGMDKGILEYVKSLIPRTLKGLFKLLVKVGSITVTAILVIFITSSIATAFCSYSEICSLKFAGLGWENRGLEESVRAFITPEKMSFLGSFINNAIHKYENLNRKKSKSLK